MQQVKELAFPWQTFSPFVVSSRNQAGVVAEQGLKLEQDHEESK